MESEWRDSSCAEQSKALKLSDDKIKKALESAEAKSEVALQAEKQRADQAVQARADQAHKQHESKADAVEQEKQRGLALLLEEKERSKQAAAREKHLGEKALQEQQQQHQDALEEQRGLCQQQIQQEVERCNVLLEEHRQESARAVDDKERSMGELVTAAEKRVEDLRESEADLRLQLTLAAEKLATAHSQLAAEGARVKQLDQQLRKAALKSELDSKLGMMDKSRQEEQIVEMYDTFTSVRAEVEQLEGANAHLQQEMQSTVHAWQQEVLDVKAECDEVMGA